MLTFLPMKWLCSVICAVTCAASSGYTIQDSRLMPPRDRAYWERQAAQIAAEEGIPAALFMSLITAESGWNPDAQSPAGAIGLGQLMPGTASGLGVDPHNPMQNLRGAAKYLASMLKRFGSPELALSAYNSGPGGTEADGRIEGFSETQAYVKKVMGLMKTYAKYDSGGNVGTLPGIAKQGKKSRPQIATSYINAPSDLGVRANVGPLSKRVVADIQRRASQPLLVGQTITKKQMDKNPVLRAAKNGKGIQGFLDYNAPLAGKWKSGGGKGAHGARAIGNWQSDNAVDLLTPMGTPVYAMADGVIGDRFGALDSSDPRMQGLRLTLMGKKNQFYYAHLSRFAPGIKPGARVRRGQLLGFSGRANGVDHLHLGFMRGDPDYLLSYWK